MEVVIGAECVCMFGLLRLIKGVLGGESFGSLLSTHLFPLNVPLFKELPKPTHFNHVPFDYYYNDISTTMLDLMHPTEIEGRMKGVEAKKREEGKRGYTIWMGK